MRGVEHLSLSGEGRGPTLPLVLGGGHAKNIMHMGGSTLGVDIHTFVEVKPKKSERWQFVPGTDDLMNRSYTEFAILAGIRNNGYYNLARGEEVEPILQEPRGLPEGLSPETSAAAEYWQDFGWEFNHLTLRELLDYDWGRELTLRAYVSLPVYWEWTTLRSRYGQRPSSYLPQVESGQKLVTVEEMQAIIDSVKTRVGPSRMAIATVIEQEFPHIVSEIEWREPYFQLAKQMWGKVIPIMINEARKGNLNFRNVRLVFWFDS